MMNKLKLYLPLLVFIALWAMWLVMQYPNFYEIGLTQGENRKWVILLLAALLLVVMVSVMLKLRRAVSSLEESVRELDFHKFALNQHSLVSITDLNGTILYSNDKFSEVSQYCHEELLGKNHRLLNSGYHTPAFFEEMWETISQGRVWRSAIRNRRKDGSHYWVDSTILPMLDAQGKPMQYFSIRTDITSHVEVDEYLSQQHAFYERINETLGEGLYVQDASGRCIYMNSEAERLLGWTREEFIGMSVHDTIHTQTPSGDPLPASECMIFQTVRQTGEAHFDNQVFVRKDGSVFPVLIACRAVIDARGHLESVVVVFQDITELKKTEAALYEAKLMAEHANEVKGNFLANMSHEIRTPMNGMIGMIDLLLDTPLAEDQLEYAKIIKESSHALLEIINDILDFSKIDAGKLELESIEFSLVHVIENCIDIVSSKAQEKSLTLISFIDPAIPKKLVGDPNRIRQILLNLLSNAVKFTAEGDVSLEAKLVSTHEALNEIMLQVKDTGIGMAQDVAESLFQPFQQADSSISRSYGGTGLGLSITKNLVDLMHGTIQVETAQGMGSTFSVQIPMRTSTQENADIYPTNISGLRALVIDPHQAHGEVIKRYFESWGMFVLSFSAADDLVQSMLIDNYFDVMVVSSRLSSQNLLQLNTMLNDANARIKRIFLIERNEVSSASAITQQLTLREPVKQSVLFDALMKLYDRRNVTASSSLVDADRRVKSKGADQPEAYSDSALILLVEDNKINQQLAATILKKIGLRVQLANNGKEAAACMQSQHFSLVFMDCQMPVMDGYEATREIRQAEKLTNRHVPIVAMTANAMKGDKERCLAAGMDDYLSKPIDLVKLRRVLMYWLPKKLVESLPTEHLAEGLSAKEKVVIDVSQLKSMFGDDEETIKELLEAFVANTPELLDALNEAVGKLDFEKIKNLGHQLVGSASSFGIMEFCELSRALEQAAKSEDAEGVRLRYQHARQAFERACDFIHNRYQAKPQ